MPRLRPVQDEKPELKVAAPPPKLPEEPILEDKEIVIEAEPEQQTEVEVAAAKPEPEPKPNDATVALQKQIELLQKSEKLLKDRYEQSLRDRDEALARTREREAQFSRVSKEVEEREEIAVSATLAAAQASLAKARQDKKNAIDLGDSEAQANADVEIAIAVRDIQLAQEGKEAIDARKKSPAQRQQPSVGETIESWGLPSITTKWLKERPDLVTDPDKLAELQYLQIKAKKAGFTLHTKEFLEYIEEQLGERQPKETAVAEESAPKPKSSPVVVSAPVSREVPNSDGKKISGKVTLTPAEQEAARVAKVSLEEYARNKLKLAQMRASGEYGDQR